MDFPVSLGQTEKGLVIGSKNKNTPAVVCLASRYMVRLPASASRVSKPKRREEDRPGLLIEQNTRKAYPLVATTIYIYTNNGSSRNVSRDEAIDSRRSPHDLTNDFFPQKQ
mmetsp:Transcript_5116/g.10548  ORF Transcript_5116/g.10548 Transcript_5116/m.10548 type:complete len:111 (-) Transcript_5116:464-796(-)